VTGSVARAGQAWADWMATDGKQGVEPPDWAKKAMTSSSPLAGAVRLRRIQEDRRRRHPVDARQPAVHQLRREREVSDDRLGQKLGNVGQSGSPCGGLFAGEQMNFK